MKVTNIEESATREWELGDIVSLGDDVEVFAIVVQVEHAVMLLDLATGRAVMYMGVLLRINNPISWLTSLREKVEDVTKFTTHYPQHTYTIHLSKVKERN